jgi:hypothetical protein
MKRGAATLCESKPRTAFSVRDWMSIAAALTAAAMLAWQMRQHVNLLLFPWPLDYRENAVLYRGALIAAGHSPYDFLPFSQSQYGFVSDYLSAPLMLLFGTGFTAPRAVTAIAIILSSLLLAFYAWRRTQDRLTGFTVFSLVYISSFSHPQIPLATPNALGSLFFIVSVLTPMLMSFNRASLGISLAAGVLGLFTKLYPGLGPVFVLICLMASRDWIRAVKFALVGAVTLAASLTTVFRLFPNYYETTPGLAHAALAWDGAWLLVQGVYFLMMISPLLVFLAWRLLHLPAGTRHALLVEPSVVCALFAGAILLKIGGNSLQYYLYFYQLLFPFLLLLALDIVGREERPRRILLVCLTGCMGLLFLLAQQRTPLSNVDGSFKVIAASLPAGDLSHVLLDPPAAYFAISRGQTPADDGQTEFLVASKGKPHDLFAANAASVEARKQAGFYTMVLTDQLQPSQDHSDLSRCYRLTGSRQLWLYELSMSQKIWTRKPC